MKASLAFLALALSACGSVQGNRPAAANASNRSTGNPVCLTGGLVPADESMVNYGTTYTPNVDGPAAAVPSPHVANCDAARTPAH